MAGQNKNQKEPGILAPGTAAPPFTLPDENGQAVSLQDYAGKRIILYFYPKDGTPGCTKEACSLRDANQDILATGAVILGISADTPESHRRFKENHRLPFPLLSDQEKGVCRAYGASSAKKILGKTVPGLRRITYIIDEKGMIEKAYPRVKPAAHPQELLDYLSPP